MTILNGTFQVTSWDEKTLSSSDDGSKLAQATVTQTYQGEIEGDSEVHYFLSYFPSGSAEFVGYETITPSDNKLAPILLRHTGEFINGVASSQFELLSSENEQAMAGIGRFKSGDSGCAEYHIELK
ncbi:DUF3224 domain-containing protein [Parashewanella spongiae]|uniref:DUF3224 domain-containing protein n=1 Tax=Parashewanella spongiae TaxID=342950 RepID=A0A3A6U3A6_9GAMM|nr:DUF3224 domain-containing protein [Parashewanella spongiae]MCL1080139.1 DUF3224 domain-containing protein [Parashewanella spongiae]RJY16321.1 DUF3224 domain-containing protein [Parashewanella spongiae]